MKTVGTSFAVWCLVLGTLEANIIDDIILHNWRDKGPVMKQSDPFFNPFGIRFPFFGDLSAEEPPLPDMTITDMKIPDVTISETKTPNAKNSTTSKADGKVVVKRSIERSHAEKPWFMFPDFLSLPEISRKRSHHGHKAEVGAPDKINLTGDLTQTKNPVDRDLTLFSEGDHKQADDQDGTTKNGSKTKSFVKGISSSFPRGLSDILIIFEKVGPKTKTHSIISPVPHVCGDGYSCRNGVCELKKPETKEEQPQKRSSFFEHFDRIFLLVIPIVLGIGTVFFVLELRRIYRKMKKHAIITTLESQPC